MNARASVIPLTLLLICSASAACNAQSAVGATPSEATGALTTSTPSPSSSLILPGSMSLSGSVVTDHPRYALDCSVRIKFTVTNRTKGVVRYNFSTGQLYDVSVLDSAGREVWRWSTGRSFNKSISILNLKPGESRVFETNWNGRGNTGVPITPGVYTVSARTTSDNRPAITGSIIVNTDTDPNNTGMRTLTGGDSGAVRQVYVSPPVTATTKIVIAG